MDDIFGDIPTLDISTLINKDSKTAQPTSASTGGRFRIGPDTPELDEPTPTGAIKDKVEPTTPKGIVPEEEIVDDKTDIDQIDIPDNTSTDDSPIKAIASFLKEKGAIDYTDEEFQDNDNFIADTVNKTIEKKSTEGINNYKESLPEEIKKLIDNYEDGVPLAQLLESEQRIFEVSSISVDRLKEDSRLQEDVVSSYMANTGWTQAEITERIKELQDSGFMEKEATRSLGKLVQFEKDQKQTLITQAQQEKVANQTKQKEQITKLQKDINEKKEFFKDVPTNEVEKKAVFEAITKGDKQGRNKVTQMLSDPETYIKVAYFLEVMKGDISKLKTVATTQVVNGVKKTLDAQVKSEPSRFGKTNLSTIQNFLKSK